jgi:hypothetical protein
MSSLVPSKTESSDIKKKLTKEQLSDARPIASYNAGHIDEAIDNWWKNL